MRKLLLFCILLQLGFALTYAQIGKFTENDYSGTSIGLYDGNLAQVGLFKRLSINFGPSYNRTSTLNFLEFPVLFQYELGKWQFFTGGQLNNMVDQKQLMVGNRFSSETWSASIPMGARFNVNQNTFMEFKTTRNIVPNGMSKLFDATPGGKNVFQMGTGFKF